MQLVCFLNFKKQIDTAQVDFSPEAKGNILIPRSVIYKSTEYIVTSIEENSFINNKYIISISFAPNSKFSIIKRRAFYESSIQSISLPESLEYLEPGWCKVTPLLNYIKISPKNKYYSYVDQQMLIDKNNAKKVEIPSFINRIDHFF